MLELSRKIQDEDREINKALNDDASAIISKLYDEIKTVVDKTAEMNGYHIVFAYPDAVTDEGNEEPDGEGTEAEAARGPAVLRRQARGPDRRGRPDAQRVVSRRSTPQGKPVDVSKLTTDAGHGRARRPRPTAARPAVM